MDFMDKSLFTPEHRKLRELLRQVRLGCGLRQQDLAKKLGQPQSFVSKYEVGERRLDLLEVRNICLALGIPLREFVERLEATL
jgi:transcriptional regulator with XRE-family HTH domain